MKKRRIMIAAFLLASCLVIGFGFAALTTSMEIVGTAITHPNNDQLDAKIRFASAKDNSTYPDGTPAESKNAASIDSNDNDRALFSVNTLKNEGDTATFTFTIESVSVYDIELDVSISNQTRPASDLPKVYPTSLYTVTTDWEANKATLAKAANAETPSTITITVTVTLNTNPVENIRGDFTLLVNATAHGDPNNTPTTPESGT